MASKATQLSDAVSLASYDLITAFYLALSFRQQAAIFIFSLLAGVPASLFCVCFAQLRLHSECLQKDESVSMGCGSREDGRHMFSRQFQSFVKYVTIQSALHSLALPSPLKLSLPK